MSIKQRSRNALAALALVAAALSPAFATSNPPAGSVAINYNRCDGNYQDWGVHLFQRGSGGPAIPGVTWASPIVPTGKTDFGVYWHVKLNEFPENKVNYIIHKGDNKEQGGRDMQFDGGANKEIWVNGGDRKIYTSLEDAKKGRAENPCK
jgi:Bacterial pullanase-associated domain